MFLERSDSALSDDQLRGLKSLRVGRPDNALNGLGAHDYDLKPLAKGTFHRCYRTHQVDWDGLAIAGSRHHVLRLDIHPAANTQSLHLEQWVNNEALARGFPTPRIVHVDTSRRHAPYPFQLIEWSDGVSLRQVDETVVRKVLGQLGRELVKLHSETVSGGRWGRVGLGTLPEWDLFWTYGVRDHIEYCADNGLISADAEETMSVILDTSSFDAEMLSLLHGDLSYDNILIDPIMNDLKAVIDWEDAVLGDPVFELAGLATFHPESRHSAFLNSYYEGRARPDDFDRRFWTYYLRIALAKAVHRHRFGYSTDLKPGYQDPNDRINLALAKLAPL